MRNLVHKYKSKELTRKEAGLLLRKIGPNWNLVLLVALSTEFTNFEKHIFEPSLNYSSFSIYSYSQKL
jgi:hypothetical protein